MRHNEHPKVATEQEAAARRKIAQSQERGKDRDAAWMREGLRRAPLKQIGVKSAKVGALARYTAAMTSAEKAIRAGATGMHGQARTRVEYPRAAQGKRP